MSAATQLTVSKDRNNVSLLLLGRLASSGSSSLLSGVEGGVDVGVLRVIGGVVGRLAKDICLGKGPGLRCLFLAGGFGSDSLASLLRFELLPPATAMPGIDSSASSIIRF